jgi:hypothetical protein
MLSEYDDCFIWKCDGCPHEAVFPVHDFWSALAQLKARGWQITRDEDGWDHRCPKCKRERSASILDMKPKRVSG